MKKLTLDDVECSVIMDMVSPGHYARGVEMCWENLRCEAFTELAHEMTKTEFTESATYKDICITLLAELNNKRDKEKTMPKEKICVDCMRSFGYTDLTDNPTICPDCIKRLTSADKIVLKPSNDEVNYPPHYTGIKIKGIDIECIDVIEALGLGFLLGNALKYLWRAGKKTEDPKTDLEKAIWYITRRIDSDSCQKGDEENG